MSYKFSNTLKSYLPNRDNWFGWSALVLTMLICLLWQIFTPVIYDDLGYRHIMEVGDCRTIWAFEREIITTFQQALEEIPLHYKYVNGRLANLVYTAMQPLPIWAIKWTCGIFMALFALSLWKWSGKKSLNNNLLAISIPLLYWCALQWHDHMQSSDFQMNYTVSSLLMTVIMCELLNHDRPRWWLWPLVIVFSMWHEAFTVCLGTFLGAQWLFEHKKKYLWTIAILILGFATQIPSGTFIRFCGNLKLEPDYVELFVKTLIFSWPTILALLLWFFSRRKVSEENRKSMDRFGWSLLATLIPAILLLVWVNAPQRSHWPNDLLALLFIFKIFAVIRPVKIGAGFKTFLIVLYIAWGSQLVYWQYRFNKIATLCFEQFDQENYIFLDHEGWYTDELPFWNMRINFFPYGSFYTFETKEFAQGVSRLKSDIFLIVPPENIGKKFDELPKLPGNNDFRVVGHNTFVRRHDGTDLHWNFGEMTVGKPTLSSTPYSLMLSLIKGEMMNPKENVCISHQITIVYEGDTLDVIGFAPYPYALRNREVLSYDL